MNKGQQVSRFTLEGRFIGFVGDFEEKPKCLKLATAEGDRYIKLKKELRHSLRQTLQPGDWIKLSGEQKYKYKTGELKLKAYQVTLNTPSPQPKVPETVLPASKTKACVMVCQKSACCKRGAKEVFESLKESVRDRGLDEQVTIKATGCMKQCKSGPCVVFLPDKARYTQVAPKQALKLVDQHFAEKSNPKSSKLELSRIT